MHVHLNGEILPEDQARVPVSDRGLLYGDGLFETLLVANGRPFRWAAHLRRLRRGADFLGIRLPLDDESLRRALDSLLTANGLADAIVRITLTRGSGPRGYSPKGADCPTLLLTCHPAPAPNADAPLRSWNLIASSLRVAAGDPLLNLKTANKLLNVLARAEAEARGADEALLLNTDGHVVEAASANLFWIAQGIVHTPPLDEGALDGVTRALVLEVCQGLHLPTRLAHTTPAGLVEAEGVFLTLSTLGVVEAAALDGQPLPSSPTTRRIAESLRLQILAEC